MPREPASTSSVAHGFRADSGQIPGGFLPELPVSWASLRRAGASGERAGSVPTACRHASTTLRPRVSGRRCAILPAATLLLHDPLVRYVVVC
jgi:hypothetical protein